MNRVKYIIMSLCAIVISSCTNELPDDSTTENIKAPVNAITLSRAEVDVVNKTNKFALEYFKAVCEQEEGNVTCSPLSMAFPLAVLANAAEGETLEEILNTLGFDADELEQANMTYAKLMEELPLTDINAKVALANSLWCNESFEYNESFINKAISTYDAEIYFESFTGGVKEKIDKWGLEHTFGKVPKTISKELTPIDVLAVVNALYFKSDWATPFDKANTKTEQFTNIDKTKSEVDMMHGNEIRGTYCTAGKMSVANIPFGNGSFRICLMMPATPDLVECVKSLEISDIDRIATGQQASINLSLPRFKADNSISTLGILAKMGIHKAMTDESEITKVLKDGRPVTITHAETNGMIAVDEAGCEAASTSVVTTSFISPSNPINIDAVFNRPFAFFIYENSTKAILFAGKVEKL